MEKVSASRETGIIDKVCVFIAPAGSLSVQFRRISLTAVFRQRQGKRVSDLKKRIGSSMVNKESQKRQQMSTPLWFQERMVALNGDGECVQYSMCFCI
jgi:DNA-binding GntR family transcriptional regulator